MKGNRVDEFAIEDKIDDDALAAMLGPTGNMRAPLIRCGKTILVGYNDTVFARELG